MTHKDNIIIQGEDFINDTLESCASIAENEELMGLVSEYMPLDIIKKGTHSWLLKFLLDHWPSLQILIRAHIKSSVNLTGRVVATRIRMLKEDMENTNNIPSC